MKSRSSYMADRAAAALSAAICAYNRPIDPYRAEQFAILLGNAWELLLKARILQLNKNRFAAIAVYEKRTKADGTPGIKRYRKKTRSGNTMTIGMFDAFDRLVNQNADPIHPVVRENLEAVTEVRDTSLHFVNASSALAFESHEVFAASVSNLLALMRDWFGHSYDGLGPTFLPLALAGRDFDVMARGSEKRLIAFLQRGKGSAAAGASERFFFGLRITVEAKKSASEAAAKYRLTRDPNAQVMKLDDNEMRERFAWTYEQVIQRCKNRYINFKQNSSFYEALKNVKSDPNLHHRRLLDRDKPDGGGKDYYSTNVWKVLDSYWTRKQGELAA